MKILVVEDEFDLMSSIKHFLETEGYNVEVAGTYSQAMDKVLVYEYSCILLDINLPGGNGLEILKEIKKQKIKTSVIIISARDSLDDKIAGLDLGSDDYLTKPFHFTELKARLKAVLRRNLMDGDSSLVLGNVNIEYDNHEVKINNTLLKLNRKEYDILLYFCTNLNRVITKEALAESVWGDNIDLVDSFDFIYSQVKNLRKKLKDNVSDVEIENIYGIGYKAVIQEQS